MFSFKKWQSSQDGIIFVSVILTVALSLTLATAALSYAGNTLFIMHHDVTSIRAFNLAEAGISRACSVLWDDPSFRGTIADEPLGGGSYTATVADAGGDEVLITAIGTVGSVQRTIEAIAEVGAGDNIRYGNYFSGDIDLIGNIHIKGDLVSSGTIRSTANLHVSGSVMVSGDFIYDQQRTKIGGDIIEDLEPVHHPVRDVAYYEQLAGENVYNGDQTFNSNKKKDAFSFSDLTLVKGDVYLAGYVVGEATLVATGDVHIIDNLDYVDSDSKLLIIALGSIYLEGGPQIVGMLYTGNSVVVVHNVSNIFGGIAAGTISMVQTSPLHIEVDPRFKEGAPGMPSIGVRLISWEEK